MKSDSAGTLLQTFPVTAKMRIYADKEQEAVEAIQAQSVLHAVAAAERSALHRKSWLRSFGRLR